MCLLSAPLMLAGCSTATLPKLGDLMGDQDNAKVTATPQQGGAGAPTIAAVPPAGATIAAPHPLREGTDVPLTQPAGAARGSDMIVGFKGPTVVLFGGEVGNDGERVSTSSLLLPLQTKYAPSNATRVQIDTPYGPRWVARSDIVFGSSGRQPSNRPPP